MWTSRIKCNSSESYGLRMLWKYWKNKEKPAFCCKWLKTWRSDSHYSSWYTVKHHISREAHLWQDQIQKQSLHLAKYCILLTMLISREAEPLMPTIGCIFRSKWTTLHDQTEPVSRRMRATLTETEPVPFDANYQATVC